MKLCLTLLCAAGAAALAATPVYALDFVLHTMTVVDDGVTKEQLYVQNDAHTSVLLSLPRTWTRSDGPTALTVIPPDINNSLVRLERSTVSADTPFAGHGLEAYRRRAQADLPQGATAAKCDTEHDQPLPIFGWKDHEFIFSYDFFGQTYKRSVLFVTLNAREQIMVTALAPVEGFDKVRDAGLELLRSWQVVPTP